MLDPNDLTKQVMDAMQKQMEPLSEDMLEDLKEAFANAGEYTFKCKKSVIPDNKMNG